MNDTVKATSITAFVTVLTFLVGRYFEQNRDRKLKVNAEKIAVYKKFFDFYFSIFSHEKIHGLAKPAEEILTEMLEFQKDLVFWGSDEVLKCYLEYKDSMVGFSARTDGETGDDLAISLAVTIKSVAKLLVAMRKDIGYTFTVFSAKDLARLQLANDPETLRIFKHL